MFWRRTPPTPEGDPTLDITPSPLSGPPRPSEVYLLTITVEAHLIEDHLRETYRPRPKYDEQVGGFEALNEQDVTV